MEDFYVLAEPILQIMTTDNKMRAYAHSPTACRFNGKTTPLRYVIKQVVHIFQRFLYKIFDEHIFEVNKFVAMQFWL